MLVGKRASPQRQAAPADRRPDRQELEAIVMEALEGALERYTGRVEEVTHSINEERRQLRVLMVSRGRADTAARELELEQELESKREQAKERLAGLEQDLETIVGTVDRLREAVARHEVSHWTIEQSLDWSKRYRRALRKRLRILLGSKRGLERLLVPNVLEEQIARSSPWYFIGSDRHSMHFYGVEGIRLLMHAVEDIPGLESASANFLRRRLQRALSSQREMLSFRIFPPVAQPDDEEERALSASLARMLTALRKAITVEAGRLQVEVTITRRQLNETTRRRDVLRLAANP
jgi:hypothetical protein